MKIVERQNNICVKGAKLSTADRPENLADFLNYVNLTLIIGIAGSGKSSLIKNLLHGTKECALYNNIFHSVYYISPSLTMGLNLPDEKLISLGDNDNLAEILTNILDEEKDIGEEDEPHHVAIFLDDAVAWLAKDKASMKIFMKLVFNGRHILGSHSSLQTFIVSQKIKSIPLTIRSQANQIFFFNSTKKEKIVMAEEYIPLDKDKAFDIMDYIFDEKFNFMFINLQMPINSRIHKGFNNLEILDDE